MVLFFPLTICEENIYANKNPGGNNHNLEGWELVWNDEFDGDAIDDQKWNKLHGGPIG